MKRAFTLLSIILLLMLFLINPLYAQLVIQEDGTTVGGFASTLNFTGNVAVSGVASDKTVSISSGAGTVEVLSATTDTVTTAESGKRFIYDNSSQKSDDTTVTLPTAASSLIYHFTDGGMGTATRILIDPVVTDRIVYLGLDAGDKLRSSGVTGDTVTLIGETGFWYIGEMGAGLWEDGGA